MRRVALHHFRMLTVAKAKSYFENAWPAVMASLQTRFAGKG